MQVVSSRSAQEGTERSAEGGQVELVGTAEGDLQEQGIPVGTGLGRENIQYTFILMKRTWCRRELRRRLLRLRIELWRVLLGCSIRSLRWLICHPERKNII